MTRRPLLTSPGADVLSSEASRAVWAEWLAARPGSGTSCSVSRMSRCRSSCARWRRRRTSQLLSAHGGVDQRRAVPCAVDLAQD